MADDSFGAGFCIPRRPCRAAGVRLRVTVGGPTQLDLSWQIPQDILDQCDAIEVWRATQDGTTTVDPAAEFSIAYGNLDGTEQAHWHANAAGDYPGVALEAEEIGGSSPHVGGPDEICRGLGEFTLSGLRVMPTATLTCKVRDMQDLQPFEIGGLFGQSTPYAGDVDIQVYIGNSQAELTDYDAPAIDTLAAAFNTTGAIVDTKYNIDVTDVLNKIIIENQQSIGFRLKTPTEPIDPDTAITFYDMELDAAVIGSYSKVHDATCLDTSWQDTLLTEGQQYCYYIVVKDSGDNTIAESNTTCAYPGVVPSIDPIADREDDIDELIDVTWTATGTTPITWSAEGLPPSLSIDIDGRVTGTLTAVGDYNVLVRANNVLGVDETTFTWSVVRLAPIVDDPGPQLNAQYDNADLLMTLSQGTPPITWSATGQPPGAVIDQNGLFSGTLSVDGVFATTVRASNSRGFDEVTFDWTVTEVLAPVLDNPGDQSSTQGDTLTLPITYSAGTLPFLWTAFSLPTGLSIDQMGVISGTAEVAGAWNTTVRAENAAGFSEVTFYWEVIEQLVAPIVETPPPQSDDQDAEVGLQMNLIQGSLPVAWSAINLPPGLSIDENLGFISGSCPEDAVYNPTVRATNVLTFGQTTFQWTINTIPPDIKHPGTQNNEILVPLTLAMELEGGSEPTLWEISDQPPGLSINSVNGVISGTPTSTGTYSTTVTATNTAGPDSVVFDWIIFALVPVVADPGDKSTAENETFTPFFMTLQSGSLPVTWSVAAGNPLPPGVTLNPTTGEISGTTTTIGEYDPVVEATNDAGTGSVQFHWSVGALAPVVDHPGDQNNLDGDVVPGLQMTATGTEPFTWSIDPANPLPPGLTIDPGSGIISGTISGPGTFNPIVIATNAAGPGQVQFQWIVTAVQLIIDNPGNQSDPDGTAIADLPMTWSQGSVPITWSSINLPDGLSIDENTGIISGTPSDWGTSNVTIIGTNAFGPSNVQFDWEITQVTPVVADPGDQTNQEGDAPTIDMSLTSGSLPVVWSVDPLYPLPTGLSINSATGVISGTCTAWGSYTPRIVATNGATPPSGHVDFLWEVTGFAPVIADPGSQSNVVTDVISLVVTATGSDPITWSIDPAHPLPPSLALTDDTGPSCEITGTLTTAGDYSPRLIASNGVSPDDAVDIPWTVAPSPNQPVINTIDDQDNFDFSVINLTVSIASGSLPITWQATGLPDGLTIAATGDTSTAAITGTISGTGVFACTVTAENAHGIDDEQFSWTVRAVAPVVDPVPPQSGVLGETIDPLELTATGSVPITWSDNGNLPPDLTLDANTGIISGTLTATGTYNPIVTAMNVAGSDNETFEWQVTDFWTQFPNLLHHSAPRYEGTVWSKTASLFDVQASQLLYNDTPNYSADLAGSVQAWVNDFSGSLFSSADQSTDEENSLVVDIFENRLRVRHIAANVFNGVCIANDLAGGWKHVVVTANGTAWNLYVDGAAQALLGGFPQWTRWNWDHYSKALTDISGSAFTETGTEIGGLTTTSNKWCGAVEAANGFIYCCPRGSTQILKIDPVNDTLGQFGSYSSGQWFGGVLAPNGKIYCIPGVGTVVLKIDPDDDTTSEFGALAATTYKYFGGALARNNMIYGVPFNGADFLKIDPTNDTASTFGTSPRSQAFVGCVTGANGAVYAIPYDSPQVYKINPDDDTAVAIGPSLGAGGQKWFGGVLGPNGVIYGIPNTGAAILRIDTSNDAVTTFGSFAGSGKWNGGVLAANNIIYSVPSSSTTVLRLDPSDDSTSLIGSWTGSNKWQGGILSRTGNMFGVPSSSDTVLKYGGAADDLDPAFPMSRAVNKL